LPVYTSIEIACFTAGSFCGFAPGSAIARGGWLALLEEALVWPALRGLPRQKVAPTLRMTVHEWEAGIGCATLKF
jgi:hypothetical protein